MDDVINVPEREIELFYVIGEVAAAGAYELPRDQTLLVTQAIAWAGGPIKTANSKKGVLMRYSVEGTREEIAINLDHIIKGKRPDVPIRPNDVVFIPGSTFKRIGYALIGVVPRTLSDAIIRGPIR